MQDFLPGAVTAGTWLATFPLFGAFTGPTFFGLVADTPGDTFLQVDFSYATTAPLPAPLTPNGAADGPAASAPPSVAAVSGPGSILLFALLKPDGTAGARLRRKPAAAV